jgi:hypothetical protein
MPVTPALFPADNEDKDGILPALRLPRSRRTRRFQSVRGARGTPDDSRSASSARPRGRDRRTHDRAQAAPGRTSPNQDAEEAFAISAKPLPRQ